MDDADKRLIPVSFRFPAADLAGLENRTPAGGTLADTARAIVLDELGVRDTARRDMPRSCGKPRTQHAEGGHAPVVSFMLSAREAQALDGHRGHESRQSAARDLLRQGLARAEETEARG